MTILAQVEQSNLEARSSTGLTVHAWDQQELARALCHDIPRGERPPTFSNLFKNSIATVSGAGEKVKMSCIILVASTLNEDCEKPILSAMPKDSWDSCAAVQREMRYCAGAI